MTLISWFNLLLKGGKAEKVKKVKQRDEGLSSKQKLKIVSKETISTSESDSDSDKLKIASG
jgi:RNA polymerase-associated protein CTR9